MSCLWGLPITGDPITGTTDSASIQGRLYDLLGIKDHEIKGLMKKRGKDANERTSDILVSKKALSKIAQRCDRTRIEVVSIFLFKIIFVFYIFNNVLIF